jgi:hypothetical protein
MSKLGFLQNIFLFIILLLLSGCGNSPNVQISEISRDTISYDETIHINNCGGKADSEQTASRSFATTVEGGAEISAGYQSIIEGSLSTKYSEYRNISKSQKLTAPPNTNMEFVLRWSEDTHAGNITINGEIGNYVVKVPVAVEQISTQDLECDGTQSQAPSISPTNAPVEIPTSAPSPVLSLNKYEFVSLQKVGVYDSGNLGLQAGIQTLANTDFEVGWLVTTRSQDTPNSTDNIVLDVRETSSQVSKVHFLWQAGWCFLSDSTRMGTITLVFSDGRKIDEPVIVGSNIRDWSKINSPLSSPYALEAWNGVAPDGKTRGIIDMFTINLSSEYASTQLVQIEIKDETMEILNSLNPAFHLWAVTMER